MNRDESLAQCKTGKEVVEKIEELKGQEDEDIRSDHQRYMWERSPTRQSIQDALRLFNVFHARVNVYELMELEIEIGEKYTTEMLIGYIEHCIKPAGAVIHYIVAPMESFATEGIMFMQYPHERKFIEVKEKKNENR